MKSSLIKKINVLGSDFGGYEELLLHHPRNSLVDIALFNEVTIPIRPWLLQEELIFLDEFSYKKGTRINITNKYGELLYTTIPTQVILTESGTYQESTSSSARAVLGFNKIEKDLFWTLGYSEIVYLWIPQPGGEKVIQLWSANGLNQKEIENELQRLRLIFSARNQRYHQNELLIQPSEGTALKIYYMPGVPNQNLSYTQIKEDKSTFFREYITNEVLYFKPDKEGWFVLEAITPSGTFPTVLQTSGSSIITEGINTNRIKQGSSGTYFLGYTSNPASIKTFSPLTEEECVDVGDRSSSSFKIICYAI